MKLSRTVTYALKATLQLAQNTQGGPVPRSRLAAQGAMPERFLLQILRSLVTHGILKSTRGVDGGYVLLREPTEISLLDVIEAIEGPRTHDVAFGDGLPESTREKLMSVLDVVTKTALDRLSSVKLADLVCSPEEFAAMTAAQQEKAARQAAEKAAQQAATTTRIDGPADVSQTPTVNPRHGNPANPIVGSPDTTPTQVSPAQTATPPAPNVIGTPNPLPGVNPNSGTSF